MSILYIPYYLLPTIVYTGEIGQGCTRVYTRVCLGLFGGWQRFRRLRLRVSEHCEVDVCVV